MPATNPALEGDEQTHEVKRQFREALQRKQANAAHSATHEDSGASKQQPHGPAGRKRQFRRKSG